MLQAAPIRDWMQSSPKEITFHLDDSKHKKLFMKTYQKSPFCHPTLVPLARLKSKNICFEENKESREGAKRFVESQGILGILCAALVGGIVFKNWFWFQKY